MMRKPPGGLIGRRLRQWYLEVSGNIPADYKKKPLVYAPRKSKTFLEVVEVPDAWN